jgi:lysozyme family protein
MTVFDTKQLPALLAREGGEKYTNHPSDRGGPTKWGVTAAKLGEYRRLGRAATPAEVQALTRDEAASIYRNDYWLRPGYALIEPLSERIAEELLDTGVNMGVGVPGRWLQRALNALNRQGRDYRDIAVDNAIGNGTRDALAALIRTRGKAGAEDAVLKLLNGLQAARYLELSEKRQPNEDFMYGWLANRVGL